MELMRKNAVVDNDFLEHMVAIESADPYVLICLCCDTFSVNPIIHGLVYDNEVRQEHLVVKRLIDESILAIIRFNTFLPTAAEQAYYDIVVRDLYYKLKEKELDLSDVFNDWRRQESLGEIHSITMCIMLQYDIFLSDDGDSKELQRLAFSSTKFIKNIRILNRDDVCKLVMELPGKPINRDMRRAIGHQID